MQKKGESKPFRFFNPSAITAHRLLREARNDAASHSGHLFTKFTFLFSICISSQQDNYVIWLFQLK